MSAIIVQSIVYMFIFAIIPIAMFVIYYGVTLKKPRTLIKETSWTLRIIVVLMVGFPMVFTTLYANSPAREPSVEDARDYVVNDMLVTDRGIVVAGYRGEQFPNPRAIIEKYDLEGTLQWRATSPAHTVYETLSIDIYGDIVATGTYIWPPNDATLNFSSLKYHQRIESRYDLQSGEKIESEREQMYGDTLITHEGHRFTFETEPYIEKEGWRNKSYHVTFELDQYQGPWNITSATHDFMTATTSYDRFRKAFDIIYYDEEISVVRMTFATPAGYSALDKVLILDHHDLEILYQSNVRMNPSDYVDYEAVVRHEGKTYIMRSQPYHTNSRLIVIDETFEEPTAYITPWQDSKPGFRTNATPIEDSTLYLGGTWHIRQPGVGSVPHPMFATIDHEADPDAYQGMVMAIDLDDLDEGNGTIDHAEIIPMRKSLCISAMHVEGDRILATGTYYSSMVTPSVNHQDVMAVFEIDSNGRHQIIAFSE